MSEDETGKEAMSNPEVPQYTREQVVEGFRKFVERGVTNPDDLASGDPEVDEAQAAYFAWNAQEKAKADRNPDPAAGLEYSLSASTLYLDAGFSDPDYVDEVANDWLDQDLERAESEGLTEVAAKIQAKIDELNARGSESGAEESAETAPEEGPTVEQLAAACGEVLSEDDCAELASMSTDEAVGYAFTLLLENGVEDPEQYLRDKGILE